MPARHANMLYWHCRAAICQHINVSVLTLMSVLFIHGVVAIFNEELVMAGAEATHANR